MPKHDIVVGLDIGTSKVAALVGEITPEGVEVIGVGSTISTGLNGGVVKDIEATVAAIERAYKEATMMAGVETNEVFLSISGSHIRGKNSHGTLAIKHQEITLDDVDQVLEQAKAVPMPPDRVLLHCLVQEFIIDNQEGIRVPIGMSGIRLEAKTFLVEASRSVTDNFVKCCTKCGLEVVEPVLSSLASAYAVLTEDERKLGVALVDIGAGTSDVIIFYKDAVVYTGVVDYGGEYITKDIAVGLKTPMHAAEDLKKRYGCAIAASVDKDETIEVPRVGSGETRPMSRQSLCNFVEARTEEILQLVHKEIKRSEYEELLGAGVVLTGGVTSMNGVKELAEEIFSLPVRIGLPNKVSGYQEIVLDPQYSTACGLLIYGSERMAELQKRAKRRGSWWKRFLDWLFD